MSTAIITGGSAGLGRALASALASRGWVVVVDGRDAHSLHRAAASIAGEFVALPGDVTDPDHRTDLLAAARRTGRLDLLVNNASTLGPTPMPRVADLDEGALDRIWLTNVAAPIALARAALADLRSSKGTLVSISSDAALEHYVGWGGYAATKAALDHLTLSLAAEEGWLRAYVVDPGDMRTAMHQAAFPGEDISDRPWPDAVVPHLMGLLETAPPSGRYRAADLPVATGVRA